MEPIGKPEGIEQDRRHLMGTAAIGIAAAGAASLIPTQLDAETAGNPVFETVNTRKEEAVLFAEIAALQSA
jgi:hypothetical protein